MSSSPPPAFIAVDLGAETVRVSQATVSPSGITIRELHRAPNRPLRLPDRVAWNITGIFDAVLDGIAAAEDARSVGVDGWGVDFALLREDDSLVALPRSYRDALTSGILPVLSSHIAPLRLFERTGIQMMEINTICQLLATQRAGSMELVQASRLLLLPDLISYWLGGDGAAEATNASTTQMLGVDGAWADDVLEACSLPRDILPSIVPAGSAVGRIRRALDDRTAHGGLPIVAVASHDTASAVVGTPLLEPQTTAYISSGTWSLVGVEQTEPSLGIAALEHNLSNERGFAGTFRLLRNVMGMWLVQRCRAHWARQDGTTPGYSDLMQQAAAAPPFGALIDPDHPELLRAANMPRAIRDLCRATGERPPSGRDQLLRTILESLALRYRWILEAITAVTGREIRTLHVVGGGANNELLCGLAASATHRLLLAGPVEATTIGNVIVQACAEGVLPDVHAGRDMVARSTTVRRHDPVDDPRWDEAYARFRTLPSVGSASLSRPLAPSVTTAR